MDAGRNDTDQQFAIASGQEGARKSTVARHSTSWTGAGEPNKTALFSSRAPDIFDSTKLKAKAAEAVVTTTAKVISSQPARIGRMEDVDIFVERIGITNPHRIRDVQPNWTIFDAVQSVMPKLEFADGVNTIQCAVYNIDPEDRKVPARTRSALIASNRVALTTLLKDLEMKDAQGLVIFLHVQPMRAGMPL